jgi:4-amino-4-deoxy-L-arabinose transferase-like glycosyltransferase
VSIKIKTALLILFSIAFFLRVYHLDRYPLPIQQDELSNVYDGYAIAETGADRWGNKHPVILRAFGDSDYRPPLYAYLDAASIKVLGFSVIAGRLPAALLGFISLILLYCLTKKLAGTTTALLTLLVAVFSPWHILFSRMAHEGTILPSFFVLLALYLFVKVREMHYKSRYIILLGLTLGIATNAYQSTKLIFPVVAVLIGLSLIKEFRTHSQRKPRYLLLSAFVLCFLIGAAPQITALITTPEHFFSRANGTVMPFSLSLDYINRLFENFWSNLSPQFLFIDSGVANNLSVARLLPVEAIFFYTGLFFLYRVFKKSRLFHPSYIYILLFLAILPAALTNSNPHAIRSSGMLLLLPMFTASGIIVVCTMIKQQAWQKLTMAVIVLCIVANAGYFINTYTRSWDLQNTGQQNILVHLGTKLTAYKNNYAHIYIEYQGNQPYIYIAAFSNMRPSEFQKAPKQIDTYGFDLVTRMGNYFFLTADAIDSIAARSTGNDLYVYRTEHPDLTRIDSINDHGQTVFFYEKKR